ncbi:hypothetical protein X943_001757 [Babesia divergens]|uniref:Uncharacterized protein n=1 Tax=Babesia divergens TaxID=32595 RepID=A0AAD9LEX5_BABDI|nr:hypothetical protein X943_001757 [Babesia divergens]
MPAGTQGGKKKPLKAPKKVTVETEEDIEFKKNKWKRRKTARKELLQKQAAKKK